MKAIYRKSARHQGGWSMIQIGLFIGVLGFFLLFGFKTIPQYAENRYVESGLRALAGGGKLEDMTDAEIKSKMDKFYLLNNVRSEGPSKSLKIERTNEKVLVTTDYETRVPFFYNIDLVFVFQNHLDSTRPGQCCSPAPSLKK